MTMTTGAQLGPYEILSQLGAGGMGEVYRARDTRLNREVAVKVLPASFANDEDRLRRFEQEARATSALNHPNILTVYDIGTHEGAPYIVAELLEGEELREQMNHGAIASRKAIEYATQIASGLAAAHAKAIVHRDLKPENIFLTADGRVKILDFGLAKLRPQSRALASGSDVQTQKALTDPGVVMGTVGYMSPEQVRGHEADHRADIFSFGVILYEMLSGQRAFQGESLAETMTAIVKEEPPDLIEINSKVPPQLDRIVRRCIEKKPERRFQSTSDLGFALEASSLSSGSNQTLSLKALPEGGTEKAGVVFFKRERWLWLAVSLLLAIAALVSTLLYARQPSPEAQVARFPINLPTGTNTAAISAPVLALSPDGRRLVFNASDAAGKSQLWLRPLDSFATQPLSGTDGAAYPFWSPDGRHIAFFADNKLKKLDVGSGVIETIYQPGAGQGGDWNQQGVILFSEGEGTGLSRVNMAGGKPEAVTELDAAHGETNHNFPSFLPDGKHYLFHIRGGDNPGIYVGSLDARDRKLLIPLSKDGANATRAVWSPQGYILYALNRTTLLARAFDPDRLELQGEPFR
ncbi:MAG: protein kinase, partial [Acidobacteriota bacterium]